jgi:hypothetical protein
MEAQDAAPCTPIVLVSKDVIVSSGIEGVSVTCVEAWGELNLKLTVVECLLLFAVLANHRPEFVSGNDRRRDITFLQVRK